MMIGATMCSAPVAQALKGKVSLITGSTSGIGLGIARALAGAGSDVVLNGFGKPEKIESGARERRQGLRRARRLFARRHV